MKMFCREVGAPSTKTHLGPVMPKIVPQRGTLFGMTGPQKARAGPDLLV